MENISEVLADIFPGVEWSLVGNDYDDINWHGKDAPMTKEQFEVRVAQFKADQAKQKIDKEASRQAILKRLGLTSEEMAILLG